MPIVYVYGTLKHGYGNHRLLEVASTNPLGTARFTFKAKMFCVGFPVLMKSRSKITVEGELYEVDTATFKRLDRLESNGRMYKRKRKKLPNGKHAWYYMGMNSYWQPRAYGKHIQPDDDGVIRWRRS